MDELNDKKEKKSFVELWIEEWRRRQAPLSVFGNAEGKIGYLLAWMLGVPVWILLLVFIVRGG